MIQLAKMLDETERISYIFIPDIPGSFESLEISASALSVTEKIRIGSGVIRLLEYEQGNLLRRLETLQSISSNRFVLGVGTGNPGLKPAQRIRDMLQQLERIQQSFDRNPARSNGAEMPETFIATLRQRIALAVAGHSTGILMNFCSPRFAQNLIKSCKKTGATNDTVFGCYLKVFYSKDKQLADRLLIEEFAKYDQMQQYHDMFMLDGIADAIASANESLESKKSVRVPDELLKISLSNPSIGELIDHLKKYREAGVSLPCVYPYFPDNENEGFKMQTISKIGNEL